MSELADYDKFQLGQLVRFKAHSIDIATRTKKPDLEQKKKDAAELEKYLNVWSDRSYPVTGDITWAKNKLNIFRKWLNNPVPKVNPAENTIGFDSDLLFKHICTRRSIRYWKKQPVPISEVKKILEAGIYAPSAFNRLPWRFFVAETPVEQLGDGDAGNPGMFASAPVRIFVAVDERLFFEKFSGPLDAGLAMQNMLLMAHALGLGCCLIYQGEYVDPFFLEKYYKVPSYCKVYCAILMGYPDEDPEIPVRMPVEEITEFLGQIPNPEF